MTILFPRQCVTFAVGCITAVCTLCCLPAAAQGQREAPGFWGLRPGNEITVLAVSTRRTEISVDGKPDVVRETSESQRIQYRVVAIDRSGDVAVKAVVQAIERIPPTPVFNRLAGATFSLTIEPDGQMSPASLESRDSLVTYLSNGDPESAAVLKKCVTEETIASWFNVPFWLIQPPEATSEMSWPQTHDLSLGTMGTVHLDLEFQPGKAQDHFAEVKIAGKARFRPLVLPEESERVAFPFWSNTQIEIDGISGTGRMAVPPAEGEAPVRRRPSFESVEWTVRLHGDTQLPREHTKSAAESSTANTDPGATVTAPANADVSRATFRMTLNQLWTLQSYSIGSPRMFDNGGAPVPVE